MPINVRAADGVVIRFPNGTPPTVIQRAMAQDHAQRVIPYQQGRQAGSGGGGAIAGPVVTALRNVPFATELGAGLGAGIKTIQNVSSGQPADFGAEFNRERAQQQGIVDAYAQNHPALAKTARWAGLGAQVALAPEIAPFKGVGLGTRIANGAVSGGTFGAVNGASQPGTLQQRMTNAARGGTAGQLVGSTLAAAAPYVLKAPGIVANALKSPTVSPVVTAETAPLAHESLNRAGLNTVLSNFGETLPPGVNIGQDGLAYVKARTNLAKLDASRMARGDPPDQTLIQELNNVASDAAYDLPKSLVDPLKEHLAMGLVRLYMDHKGGEFNGFMGDLEKNANFYENSDKPLEPILAAHLRSAQTLLKEFGGRAFPDYAAAQNRVDAAKANLAVLEDATGRPGAGENGFTAAQLNSAVLAQRAKVPRFTRTGDEPEIYGLADKATSATNSSNAGIPAPSTPPPFAQLGAPSNPDITIGRGDANAFGAVDPAAASQLIPKTSAMEDFASAVPTSITALSRAAAIQQGAGQGNQQTQ